MTLFEKTTVTAGGLIAIAIGAAILTVPATFFASYGIVLTGDPNLMSEVRAPGAVLLALGTVLCIALIRPAVGPVALWLGALLYGAYGLARVVSILVDGWPDAGLVTAMVLELALAVVFAAALILRWRRGSPRVPGRALPA